MRRLDARTARMLAVSCFLLATPLAAWAGGESTPSSEGSGKAPMASCTKNDQCGQEEFCARLFGECEQPGKCEEKPKDCMEHGHTFTKPVCGCDGKTYDNVCLAAAAGVNIAHEGPCSAS